MAYLGPNISTVTVNIKNLVHQLRAEIGTVYTINTITLPSGLQDGGGIEWGEHLLPYKRSPLPHQKIISMWNNSTKQLLNTGRGPQMSRMTKQSPQNEGLCLLCCVA